MKMATAKSKYPANTNIVHVERILERINDKNTKLTMLEYSEMVYTLVNVYRLKPTWLEKNTEFSLPHIYNLIQLAGMTPKMKSMILSGKIKATDALKILRKAKNENDFIVYATQISKNKVDHRKRENTDEPVFNFADKKLMVKKMVLEILGKDKVKKAKPSTINSLVKTLMATA